MRGLLPPVPLLAPQEVGAVVEELVRVRAAVPPGPQWSVRVAVVLALEQAPVQEQVQEQVLVLVLVLVRRVEPLWRCWR